VARASVRGLTVTIDGRSLGPGVGGTQLYTLELALALAETDALTVRVVVASDLGADAWHRLREARQVEVITYEQAIAGVELSDVVHRPQQVFSASDLNLLRLLGRRLVVTHQDLIAYHNPTYHPDLDRWEQFRRITRIALAGADRVVFFSEHSRRDAAAEDLVAVDRSDVIGAALGRPGTTAPKAPSGVPHGQQFIFCLAPDYRHKNRRFAIELLSALRTEQNWPGVLVLAGAHVAHGSSSSDEQELLAADSRLRAAVIDLGSVDDAERQWLLENARAVVVPSVVEGFGLVPLEAAQTGRPCLFAAQTSLPEVAGDRLATLVPWDASLSAARVRALLDDGPERRDHVARLQSETARWRWPALATELVACYERALRAPHRAAAVRMWQELERERHLTEVNRALQESSRVLASLGGGVALVGEDGFLTARQQRGLLRVGARPALARLLLWPFGLLGSIRHRRAGGERDH
jgi:glycosyltransferase involved in cell wall biosynthesis